MSWRRLAVLVRHLPADSAVAADIERAKVEAPVRANVSRDQVEAWKRRHVKAA